MVRDIRDRFIFVLSFASIACCLVSAISECSFAQITFEKTYGGGFADVARAVRQTQDGGYAMAGWTWSFGIGLSDVYLVKTDSMGNLLWDSTYGGGSYDAAYSLEQTSDGGYIMAGYTRSFGAGLSDVYLIKTDSLGTLLWDSTYGGASNDVGHSAVQTMDGGYVVAGETESSGAGGTDVYIIKTDSLGNAVWDSTYGGSLDDAAYSVRQTPDGGYIITGSTSSFTASGDVYCIKTDSLGNIVWDTTYGGVSYDEGNSVALTSDGGYVVAGRSFSFGAGFGDVYLVKIGALGNTLWDTTYGGDSANVGRSVQQTPDQGYVIAGYTQSFGSGNYDVYLVKTDSTGTTIWEIAYGDTADDRGHSVVQTTDSGYAVAGYTRSFGAGANDFYLIKTDGNGMVGVEQEASTFDVQGSRIKLFQNMPNPLDGSTTISYSLTAPAHVKLEIFDVAGRWVETLLDESQEPGMYRIQWNAGDRAGSVYFCRLESGSLTEVRKLILLRK
ncbi:MAG: T9SS type A sorting domain-containing protein [bacterium]